MYGEIDHNFRAMFIALIRQCIHFIHGFCMSQRWVFLKRKHPRTHDSLSLLTHYYCVVLRHSVIKISMASHHVPDATFLFFGHFICLAQHKHRLANHFVEVYVRRGLNAFWHRHWRRFRRRLRSRWGRWGRRFHIRHLNPHRDFRCCLFVKF